MEDVTWSRSTTKDALFSLFKKSESELDYISSHLFTSNRKCSTASENTASCLVKNNTIHVWIKRISSVAGKRFYRFPTTRYMYH